MSEWVRERERRQVRSAYVFLVCSHYPLPPAHPLPHQRMQPPGFTLFHPPHLPPHLPPSFLPDSLSPPHILSASVPGLEETPTGGNGALQRGKSSAVTSSFSAVSNHMHKPSLPSSLPHPAPPFPPTLPADTVVTAPHGAARPGQREPHQTWASLWATAVVSVADGQREWRWWFQCESLERSGEVITQEREREKEQGEETMPHDDQEAQKGRGKVLGVDYVCVCFHMTPELPKYRRGVEAIVAMLWGGSSLLTSSRGQKHEWMSQSIKQAKRKKIYHRQFFDSATPAGRTPGGADQDTHTAAATAPWGSSAMCIFVCQAYS